MTPACVADFRLAAKARLPRVLFDYIDGGSYAEATLRANVADIEAVILRQRILRDVSNLNLSPPPSSARTCRCRSSWRRSAWQACTLAVARRRRRGPRKSAGVPFTLSTVGIGSIAEVSAAAAQPPWFQLYMMKDRGFMAEPSSRAVASRA